MVVGPAGAEAGSLAGAAGVEAGALAGRDAGPLCAKAAPAKTRATTKTSDRKSALTCDIPQSSRHSIGNILASLYHDTSRKVPSEAYATRALEPFTIER